MSNNNTLYYIQIGLGPKRRVSKAEFIAAEQAAGFRPKIQGEVATAGFGGNGITGSIVYNATDEEAGTDKERVALRQRITEMTVTDACACTDLEKLRQEGHPELAYLIERNLDDQTRIRELIQFVDV
jgi:hypothetical protein